MKTGLTPGATAELTWRVGAEHIIELADAFGHRVAVFSTPAMIDLMEWTAREALAPFLDPNEESVGVSVSVEHLAATPIAARAIGQATVTRVDGRFVDFQIEARDDAEVIGRGVHRRAVIKTDRFAARLAEKNATHRSGDPPMMIEPCSEPPPKLSTLQVEVDGPVAKVTLNRPEKLNAVNSQMTEDWERINAFLAGHAEIRIVIITGAGSAFCSGDDVKELGELSIESAHELSLRQARMYLAWEQLPQIFIAAVNGVALGGGCVCAYSADFRIAASNARFGMPEILLGWPPGYGVAQLTAIVGKARALELCLTGKQISASEAKAFGLTHEVVPRSRLMPAAEALAQRLLAMPAEALRETKKVIHSDEGRHSKIAFHFDTAAYLRCLANDDAREGIRAFVEKRRASFRGL